MERLFVVVSAALFLLASGACQTDDADQYSATKTDKTVPEVRAYPARLLAEHDTASVTERIVVKEGGEQQRRYAVSIEALLTEEHIAGAMADDRREGLLAVWLNEEGTAILSEYSKQEKHWQKPLALSFDGRWAGFPVLHAHIKLGRTMFLGLTGDEVSLAVRAFGEPQ